MTDLSNIALAMTTAIDLEAYLQRVGYGVILPDNGDRRGIGWIIAQAR